jgi:hypothetical protein
VGCQHTSATVRYEPRRLELEIRGADPQALSTDETHAPAPVQRTLW